MITRLFWKLLYTRLKQVSIVSSFKNLDAETSAVGCGGPEGCYSTPHSCALHLLLVSLHYFQTIQLLPSLALYSSTLSLFFLNKLFNILPESSIGHLSIPFSSKLQSWIRLFCPSQGPLKVGSRMRDKYKAEGEMMETEGEPDGGRRRGGCHGWFVPGIRERWTDQMSWIGCLRWWGFARSRLYTKCQTFVLSYNLNNEGVTWRASFERPIRCANVT